jgi:hypothetical protein
MPVKRAVTAAIASKQNGQNTLIPSSCAGYRNAGSFQKSWQQSVLITGVFTMAPAWIFPGHRTISGTRNPPS